MFLGDFHIHSKFSDGQLTIPEIVDMYGERGYGVIAITDHIAESSSLIGQAAQALELSLKPETFELYLSILKSEAERAWDQYRMIVIPGYELSKNSISNKRSAHILSLNASEFMWADGDPVELCAKIHSQGALAIAAHPVHTQKSEKQTYHLWDRRDELQSSFDAWEVASGDKLFNEVLMSGLPIIASSDLHKPSQIRSWKTSFECELHKDAILDAIKKQKVGYRFMEE